MDSEMLSLLLGIVGLILGFVSAYGQIKSFVIRVLHLTSDNALRWVRVREERAAFFIRFPSAFVAYVVNRVTAVFFLFFVIIYLGPLTLRLIVAPEWVASLTHIILPTLTGALIGLLATAASDVTAVAKKNSQGPADGG